MKSLLIAAVVAVTPLPPLQPELLHAAIADLNHPVVTSAQLRVSGEAGRWYGAEGFADQRRPVRPDDRFRIGSVTKVFVATVALQLVAERRLSLDTKVRHYFPDLPESVDAVTVGQLLNHTSGIPNEVGYPDLGSPEKVLAHRYDRWTPEQLRALIPPTEPKFVAGTKQEYRGINYLLATMIIEKVAGRDLAAEVRERVTRPLGLTRTYVPGRNETRIRGAHVHGYLNVPGQGVVDVSTYNSSRAHGEGDMISTTGDLTRFAAALFGGQLVREDLLEKMFTVPKVSMMDGSPASYATGLQTFTINGITVWGKTGEWYGYNAGVFSTRDGQRRIAYSFTPTARDAAQQQMTLRIANAVTSPAADRP
ncbi:serine hydrolase domain-containing protein [Lentzea sp. BCCO 10_0856]|uniref:Serine hydrolase domain-containing protein n=1 Tax=Lentzea miocenica TaxID=3095431 RepID=A0ABU4T1J7_9PSEU|nr:serine hydrolase domain-containing protein [Lentzea sp. BCCO 10_0856]MDX8032031.1 serine hydrolase domain-containing protein [Lentzea sp. BCCO 10_0856]